MLSACTCRRSSLVMAFTAVRLVFPLSADVPFKGFGNEVITGSEQAPDGLHFTVFTTGQATHLGRFTRQASAVLHADGGV